jgi:aldehyde:ferredoxin oxidoreductase
MSLISAVMNDKGRAARRSGVGAVMGSKRLKAIVAKGKMAVPMADEDKAKELRRENMKNMMGAGPIFKQYGTAGITADSAMSGDSPVKNWLGSGPDDFPNAKAISDDAVIAKEERKFACWQCPLACGGHMTEIKGKYAMPAGGHKPEYETLCTFGTLCLNDNLDSIIRANDICNRAGLDTISAGVVVAFAIECYENGKLTKDDTGGLELTWGNDEAIVALTEMIAKREGLGDILADGVKVASQKIGKGTEEYAVHVGGEEVAMHDPRFMPGLAPTYQLDATPGRHTQGGEMIAPPAGLEFSAYDRNVYAGRAKDQKTLVNMVHYVNAAGLCLFGYITYDAQLMPQFLNAITGWDFDMDDLLTAGERIANIRRMFNIRDGINPLEWKIPGRILGHPPLEKGNIKGVELDERTMNQEFLKEMDWDQETMKPSEAKLKELGLEEMLA